MSERLSYSNKSASSTAEDWVPIEPYNDDDILLIKDPDGGLSRNPRTAIPSPFAQLDLVKNAFVQLSNAQLSGAAMNQRLVSTALDVAQLFFDYENHKDYLRIVRWNRDEQLARLEANPAHKLYGETLRLFLESDSTYNFGMLTDWFILMWDNKVLGGTSPSSLFIAAPAVETINEIKVEQGIPLFGEDRPLWKRDGDFVFALFLTMNAYPELRPRLGAFYSYMMKNLEIIKVERPELYSQISAVIPNTEAYEPAIASSCRQQLEQNFDPFSGGNDVSVLGARLYHRRGSDIISEAAASDFIIRPTRPQPEGTRLPMVICTGFNGELEHHRYIDRDWNSATEVLAGNVPIDQRKLPDTSVQYPFLTTDDFFTDTIVRLSDPLDADHYFDGNLPSDAYHGYLLPLKPELFKWFSPADLVGDTVNGRHMLDITPYSDGSVNVVLRVPIKKRYIELSRTYEPTVDPAWTFDERRNVGRVADTTVTLAVFPFVRTAKNDDYNVQMVSMIPGGNASLKFFGDTDPNVKSKVRSKRANYITSYYDVDGSWDRAAVVVNHPLGTFEGLVVPIWPEYRPSNKELIFAVDFGTTNTHVEWAELGQPSQPLTFEGSRAQTLVAPLLRPTGSLADQLQEIEFLPNRINELYGFPLRSSLANSNDTDGGMQLFFDLNIPFLYERKYFYGYDVTTNLKWKDDNRLSTEFLREITLLIKAKALIENIDLNRLHVVYFYPVSMSGNDRRKLQDTWRNLFTTFISENLDLLKAYPESIAPAYYYKSAEVSGSGYVSIDIGGGTSDVVIYQPTPDRMGSVPVAISSFRFAGNAIFGDAFTDRDADSNPLLKHYCQYFNQLIANDRGNNISYLASILQDIMRQKRSEDINAFLFSIENVEELRSLREIDRRLFSYNALLRNDEQRKLVFMYFYSAIVYYIASTMHARGYELPKQVYFSGTGSKILMIVGSEQQVTSLTQRIFEAVFGTKYDDGTFSIRIEKDCPKQITCRGGINLETQRINREGGMRDQHIYEPENIISIKYCHSMIGDRQLRHNEVSDLSTRAQLVEQVRVFNRFFLELLDKRTKDEYGLENTVVNIFAEVVNRNLDNYLTAGINAFLEPRYDADDEVEDVPFFYPIIGTIRHNLLANLCNDVIQHWTFGATNPQTTNSPNE